MYWRSREEWTERLRTPGCSLSKTVRQPFTGEVDAVVAQRRALYCAEGYKVEG
jgi:hypothetical protein